MIQVSPLVKSLLNYAVPVLIVIGLVAFLAWMGSQQDDVTPGSLSREVSSSDWIIGPVDNEIVIVEYSDFQCPTCAVFNPIMQRLIDEYGDRVSLVYRQYPLQQIHQNATLAAAATESAGLQGKFWEMHDKLFDDQNTWSSSSDALTLFTTYAQDLGLNIDQFLSDIDSRAVENAIKEDYATGTASGVSGTPTFYVNGIMLESLPKGYEPFKALIEAKLIELGITSTATAEETSSDTTEENPESTTP